MQTTTFQEFQALVKTYTIQVEAVSKIDLAYAQQRGLVAAIPTYLDLAKMAEDKKMFLELGAKNTKNSAALYEESKAEDFILLKEQFIAYEEAALRMYELAALFAQDQAASILKSEVRPIEAEIDRIILKEKALANQTAQNNVASLEKGKKKSAITLAILSTTIIVVIMVIGTLLARLKIQQDRETARVVTNVQEVLTSVNTASDDMSTSAAGMTETARTTKELSSSIASASEETSSSMQSVSAAMEEMSSTALQIQSQVEESKNIASQAINTADQTHNTVTKMAEAVEKINDVVRLINDIADQTNLLALNAAIDSVNDNSESIKQLTDDLKVKSVDLQKNIDGFIARVIG